jgi:Ca2+-binding RTX toxin-like protein
MTIGTDEDDTFSYKIGLNGVDESGSGPFTIDGKAGFDTLDLGRRFSGPFSILVDEKGTIEVGNASYTATNIERIIAPSGPSNNGVRFGIDGRDSGVGNFNIDLSKNNLTIENIPGGSKSFEVMNFNTVIGTKNNDTIKGTQGTFFPDNIISGGGGDDTFIGTAGEDTYNGDEGFNTLDYSQLGTGVTLGAKGVVSKGGLGTDNTLNINRYVGANGQMNTIDGTTNGGEASFNIDLSKNNLTLNGLPDGSKSFEVANFNKVIGTNNNDTIKGDDGDNIISGGAGNDTFIGSKGNDTYDGGSGSNTLDYSQLGTGITLAAKGVVNKGALGTDTTLNINKYVGATGQTNTIDGTTDGGAGSVDIDLSKNNLTLNGLPDGARSFEVVDFSNVVGTNNNDKIVGNDGDNNFTGGRGNDILTGGNGKDIVNGTNNTARGVGEIDTLTGGGGADTFVLGDSNGSFYLGNGQNDYASITDFDFTKDTIQLGGNKDLLSVKFDRRSGTVDLFSKQSGGKDLVAKVKLANPFNFSSRGEMGMSNAKTAMAGSGIGDDVALGSASIGGDSTSIESMFAKSVVG